MAVKRCRSQEGITLLITLLLMGVLLGVSISLLNITLKQYQLSNISYASETAFQAANAGMECALYNDYVEREFELGSRDAVSCFGIVSNDTPGTDPGILGIAESTEEQRFEFTWNAGGGSVCTDFSVYKFFENPSDDGDTIGPSVGVNGETLRSACPEGSVCTVIQSRGYNVACGERTTSSRVVEREYTQVY
jgi:hypothetical protein